MDEFVSIEIRGQTLRLLPERAIYWEEGDLLILSDLHLGKSGHFRKNGIPAPANVHLDDLRGLLELADSLKPLAVLVIGDLFHSTYNAEWELLVAFIEEYGSLNLQLVPGNHDILDSDHYQRAGIELMPPAHVRLPFVFSHDVISDLPDDLYCISGHRHPGIRLLGKGRQKMTLPCFLFSEQQALLPAFGRFTGLSVISPGDNDRIYAIAEGRIHQISLPE